MGKRHAKNGWFVRTLKDADGENRKYRVFYKDGQIFRRILYKSHGLSNDLEKLTEVQLEKHIKNEKKDIDRYAKDGLYEMMQDSSDHATEFIVEREKRKIAN